MNDYEIDELLTEADNAEAHKKIMLYNRLHAIGIVRILKALDNIAEQLDKINSLEPKKKRGERGKDKGKRKPYKKRVVLNPTLGGLSPNVSNTTAHVV